MWRPSHDLSRFLRRPRMTLEKRKNGLGFRYHRYLSLSILKWVMVALVLGEEEALWA
jgi:hypothetical protein